MQSTFMYFPLSEFYGDIDRKDVKPVRISWFDGLSAAEAVKGASARPSQGTEAKSFSDERNDYGASLTNDAYWSNNGVNGADHVTDSGSGSSYRTYNFQNMWINGAATQAQPALTGSGASNGTGWSFNKLTMNNNTSARHSNVEVANKSAAQYGFTFRNATLARSDAATISMTFDSVGKKAKDMILEQARLDAKGNVVAPYDANAWDTGLYFVKRGIVRGFKTNKLTFNAALSEMGDLKSITMDFLSKEGIQRTVTLSIYDLVALRDGGNLTGYVLNFADCDTLKNTLNDGTGLLDPSQTWEDWYLKNVDFNYNSIEPGWSKLPYATGDSANLFSANVAYNDRLAVVADGASDWYNGVNNPDHDCANAHAYYLGNGSSTTSYNHNDQLHARLTLSQTGAYDTRATVKQCAALNVPRPAMEVHTTIQYGQRDYTEQTKGDTSNSDGNRTEVTVPYAKEFTLTAQMKNERAISKLDDVDVTFSYPLELTTNISTGEKITDTGSAYTGFHPVRTTIKSAFIRTFPKEDVGKIRIFGIGHHTFMKATESLSTVGQPAEGSAGALLRGRSRRARRQATRHQRPGRGRLGRLQVREVHPR